MRGFYLAVAVVWLCLTAGSQSTVDPLVQAIRNNDLASLKTQIAAGADVNSRDRRGVAPLLYAAAFGSTEAVKLLLDSGADVHAKNAFDATALIWAAGQPGKARLLIEKGAAVNARTRQGRTPLMIAAACDGCVATVGLLLSEDADPKVQDAGGSTALDAAAATGDVDSMRLLIAHGVDANSASNAGATPLMEALSNCNLPAAQVLLEKGANVNAANTSGGQVKFGPIQLIQLTPLMIAAPYCPVTIVRTLIDAGANVNAKDIRDMTPLMLAVASEKQDIDVVRLLLQAGADASVKSKAGETALDWARKFGNPAVIVALSKSKAGQGRAVSSQAPRAALSSPRSAAAAVQLSTALLQRTATGFFRQSGCVGCHHQQMTTMAVASARASGVPVDEPAAKAVIQTIESEWTAQQEALLQRLDPGGLADGEGYSMLALAASHYPANALTDTVAVHIAALQRRQGNWHVGDATRSPLQEGDIARTARSMRALQIYGPPGRKAEFDRRILLARDWLLAARLSTNDDYAMQLVGLAWAGAGRDKLQSLGRALIAAQRADGGWAPNRNLSSDAFATGETLWALRESAVLNATDSVYQRGVKYLLSTQRQDGSWHVRSRAPKFQPYFESGFPYEHDQWISSAATAWAVTALSPAAERTTP